MYFDNISLIEEPAQTYTYDKDGNLTSVKGSGNGEDAYSFDETTQNLMKVATEGSGTYSISNDSGAAVVRYSYNGWGYETGHTTSTVTGLRLYQYNCLKYRGYYHDTETGFYYVSSRYYDPVIGRFINADEVDYLGADGELLSYNLYAYCMNNPINRTDENGNWSVLATVGVVVGASLCIAAATVLTGGVALGPVMGVIATGAAKGALIGAAVGTAAGAGIGYAKTGTLEGAANGAAIGFGVGAVAGAIIGGTSSGLKYAKTNGVKIKEVGRLKPSGKSGNGNLGIKYEIKKANGKITTRSLELHTNHAHKGYKPHWQRNTWNTYNNSISSRKSIHWTWWGKRIK